MYGQRRTITSLLVGGRRRSLEVPKDINNKKEGKGKNKLRDQEERRYSFKVKIDKFCHLLSYRFLPDDTLFGSIRSC